MLRLAILKGENYSHTFCLNVGGVQKIETTTFEMVCVFEVKMAGC
jgi:hypothetical protein